MVSDDTKTPSTWNEAGRGRKLCKTCGVYVGVRSLQCVCGASFTSGSVLKNMVSPPPEIETKMKERVKELKRLLPSSNNLSSTELEKKIEVAQNDPETGLSKLLITTPSGNCPVELKSFDRESVLSWKRAVMDAAPVRHEYSTEALIYWLRNFVPFNGSEYRAVSEILKSEIEN